MQEIIQLIRNVGTCPPRWKLDSGQANSKKKLDFWQADCHAAWEGSGKDWGWSG